MPLMSTEVRWFFPGPLARFPELQRWIDTAKPFADEGVVPAPKGEGRLDGKPDVYILVPGANDIGIKWREGQLQVKGRMARRGLQRFDRHFYGAVEVWAEVVVPERRRQACVRSVVRRGIQDAAGKP